MNAPTGAEAAAPKKTKNARVAIETSMGTIVVELHEKLAPITCANFLKYVDQGFYSGTIFHRVIKGFMIQGGGFTKALKKKSTRPPIALEAGRGISNKRGTIAMARTNVPDSATSQFFINVVDNARLDNAGGGYAAFGFVVEGMDVVEKIRAVSTSRNGTHANFPIKTITIKSAKRL
jgi:peptidyl-prolyl cis-trans isomerase A (cyclophilin A)